MKGPIVLATDGTTQSLGAARLALALAERDGCAVEVLTVAEPVPPYAAGYAWAGPAVYVGFDGMQAEQLRSAVERQVRALGGAAERWPVRVEIGSPARAIAAAAAARGAELLVLGLGQHHAVDRWLGRETALDVVRLAHCPVLAVPEDATGLPASALVATDFSAFAADVARSTAALLPEGGALHLAHVVMGIQPAASGDAEWLRTYEAGARDRLEDAARELGAGRVRVFPHLLHGEAVPTLLSLAERTGVEMVGVGSHGYGFFSRILMGSVSTRVIRGARSPVLVAPPRTVPAELRDSPAPDAAPVRAFTPSPGEVHVPNSIRTLVAGVAEGEDDRVLAPAIELAAALGAELHLVHAYDMPEALDVFPELATAREDPRTRYARTVQAELEGRVRRLTGDPRVHVRVVPGHADRAVLRAAEETGAELVVVGASRRRGTGQAFLGTVAGRVVRGSRAPVLVLRGTPGRPERVLLTTDLSGLSAAAHERGAGVAAALAPGGEPRFRSLLVLGHGIVPPPQSEEETRSAAEGELRAFLGDRAGPARRAEPRVRTGSDAAWEIAQEAAEWDADLVVVGTHGRTGLSHLLLGSVAEAVLRSAPCDVLVVPARSVSAETVELAGAASGGAARP
jgi:universal stress protein E